MSTYKPIDECLTVEELLSDPARWTQGVAARNAKGNECGYLSDGACAFCVEGAIGRIYGSLAKWVYAEQQLLPHLPLEYWGNYTRWNDRPERTHAEVIEAVRKAGI